MPVELGQRTLRILLRLFIASFAALIGAFVFSGLYRTSRVNDLLLLIPGVSVALLALALGCAPAIAFLLYSRTGSVGPALRRSALVSAIAPALVGAWCLFAREGAAVVLNIVGVVLLLLAAAVVVRAFTAARGDAADQVVLRPNASFIPVALVVVAFLSRPHGPTPAQSYATAMKSDLRNLAQAQEEYFASTKRYQTDVMALRFTPSSNVRAPSISLSDSGWSATNSHSKAEGLRCGIAVKATNPVDAAAPAGEPACTPKR